MTANYLFAKNVALGLEEGSPLPPKQNYDAISIGQRAQLGAELFSKTFETPPELIVRKSVLSLFDEYDVDYNSAHEKLLSVSEFLKKNDSKALEKFLNKNRPIEWLNCIFLEDEDIDEFAVVMEQTNKDVLKVLLEVMYMDYQKLINFKEFYATIFKRWKYFGKEGEYYVAD